MAPKNPQRCCVVGCPNNSLNSPGTIFYCFPTAKIYRYKQERRDKWIQAVRRQNPDGSVWDPPRNARICSQHFVGNFKSENPLHPGYNPTIFPSIYQKKRTSITGAMARYQRAIKRQRFTTATETTNSRKKKKLSREKHDHDAIGEVVSLNELAHQVNTNPSKVDRETQVNSIDKNCIGADLNCGTFTCKRYIYRNSSKTSDAEVQVYIPDSTKRTRNVKKKKKTVGRGNHIKCEEKTVELDTCDTNSKRLSKRVTGFDGIYSIRNDRQMLELTGLTQHDFKLLMEILSQIKDSKVSKDKRLLIFLFKMRYGLTFSALSVLFAVNKSTASRIFYSILEYLADATEDFVFWPSRETVCATMPQVFEENYSNCRVVIDCKEFRVEQPSSIESRVQFYSRYKKEFALKVLFGFLPSGEISFVSRCYGGRTDDAELTSGSAFLELLEPSDLILSIKEFSDMETKLNETGKGMFLTLPPFLHGTYSDEEFYEIYKIANVRINIERIIQRIRTHRILEKFTSSILPHADKIVSVSCVLVNLQSPIVRESDME